MDAKSSRNIGTTVRKTMRKKKGENKYFINKRARKLLAQVEMQYPLPMFFASLLIFPTVVVVAGSFFLFFPYYPVPAPPVHLLYLGLPSVIENPQKCVQHIPNLMSTPH